MAVFLNVAAFIFSFVVVLVRAEDFSGKELEFPEPGAAEEANPPYATVEGFEMPAFQDATLCFRLKTSVSRSRVSIFSYAVEGFDNEFSAEINLNKTVLFFFKNKREFGLDLSTSDFKPNEWSQMCLAWDNHEAKPQLFVGNFATGKVSNLPETEQTGGRPAPDSDVRGGGAVVIGQDQDKLMGGFQSRDGMKGLIGNVQLFKGKLSEDKVAEQMKCNAPEGDLLSWSNPKFTIKNGATLVPASAPCVE